MEAAVAFMALDLVQVGSRANRVSYELFMWCAPQCQQIANSLVSDWQQGGFEKQGLEESLTWVKSTWALAHCLSAP